MKADLNKRQAGGGVIAVSAEGDQKLSLPTTPSGKYALAQLDDYMHRCRGQFPHTQPVSLELEARVSAPDLPGTWGFGFWNDPFSAGFGAGGMRRILPVLPNAVWFFYGSDPNRLSLREDLPGEGFHAKVFRSPRLPALMSLLALPGLPLVLWPLAARGLRKVARIIVQEDAAPLAVDVTHWHHYKLHWHGQGVACLIDGRPVFSTPLSPKGKMGLVIWIDNQYFEFTSKGNVGFGFLPIQRMQSMEIRNLTLVRDRGYD
jgi:hypothetical protein